VLLTSGVAVAHPSQTGGLSAIGLKGQLETSLKALELSTVNGFYLHQPDTETPLSETLECTDSLVKEGLIKEIGMSNYSAMELERTLALCKDNNWEQPKVFQALYNPLNRMIEKDLVPILRGAGIRLVAYNPLAAGLSFSTLCGSNCTHRPCPCRFIEWETHITD